MIIIEKMILRFKISICDIPTNYIFRFDLSEFKFIQWI